jgi:hypothetical protein
MKRKSVDDAALEAEITVLPDLDHTELRARWKKLFGNPAPKSLRRKFLAKAVAYQMRVEAHGGLSPVIRRRLREIADAVRRGDVDAVLGSPSIKRGTQMIRQWKDKTLTVTALDDGFEFDGRIFSSLSAIAKAITGTNWNGYSFFGIKRTVRANKNAAGPRKPKGATKAIVAPTARLKKPEEKNTAAGRV